MNLENEYITQYYVDGKAVPMTGLGSLITFQAFDEGVLSRGKELIRAAVDLNKAASIAASTPMPSGIIRNSGADLDAKEIQGLLAAWKTARNNRSTAFLTSTLEYQPTSFSPKDMMYDEAQQFLATEIARLCSIPAYLLSAEANTSMTYANVLDERKQFFSLSLAPYVNAIQDRLSMDDILGQFRLSVYESLGNFNELYYLNTPITCTPFLEKYDDLLGGWVAEVTIEVKTPLDRCDAAFNSWLTPTPISWIFSCHYCLTCCSSDYHTT